MTPDKRTAFPFGANLMTPKRTIVNEVEAYISRFVTFSDSIYLLPISLWILGTFVWQEFDAFPYMVITSDTKRAGKTRLSEVISFCCSNPRNFGAMTAFTVFAAIDTEKPTIIFDEAEILNSEAASTMRSILNMGYRRGQTVPRRGQGGTLKEYSTYCPKVFVLIGDVFDTLKDRSIIARLKRAEPRERFVWEAAKSDGAIVREDIDKVMTNESLRVMAAYADHKGVDFLTDRDEEIWMPLISICQVICPERLQELYRCAVDMSTEKTQEKRSYVNLQGEEKKAEDDEYAKRLLRDLQTVIGSAKVISTVDALTALKELPTGPWRKFRGSGLSIHNLADMLSRFGVRPGTVSLGRGRTARRTAKGYKRESVERAARQLK